MNDNRFERWFEAVQAVDVDTVRTLLAGGLDVQVLDAELGTALMVACDQLFELWWEPVVAAYEQDQPWTEAQKAEALAPHLALLELLIAAGARVDLWDGEEYFGTVWDAASAACWPVVQRLVTAGAPINLRDDEGDSTLTSLSKLWFEVDFDQIDWLDALPEEQQVLQGLRALGAKTTAELDAAG
jgi:hypothetical protein